MENFRFSCNRCRYFIETRGPWPFYNSSGQIEGLTALVFCSACDKIKEYTVARYEKPLSSLADIWLSDIPRRTKTVCHKCKNPVYFAMPSKSVKCPRCRRGTFEVFESFKENCNGSPVPPPQTPLRVRQNGKTIRIPRPTVVIDSAEHMGYKFERFTNWLAGTIHKRLLIGDYTLLGMEDEVIVERKTLPDLVRSIIQERKGFIKKCEELSGFKKKCIVIEGSTKALKTPYEDSQAHPNAVFGSLLAAQERWDIPVYFLDNFLLAEEYVAGMLSKYHAYRWLEINGFQRCLIEGDI